MGEEHVDHSSGGLCVGRDGETMPSLKSKVIRMRFTSRLLAACAVMTIWPAVRADGIDEPAAPAMISTEVDALEPVVSPVGLASRLDDATAELPRRRFYVSGIVGTSFATLTSGGDQNFVTPSGDDRLYPNTGTVDRSLFTAGGAIGVAFDRQAGLLRAEIEGRGRDALTGTTANLRPDGLVYGGYAVEAVDGWSAMANLWRDVFLTESIGVYAGGGSGGGGYSVHVVNPGVAADPDGAGSSGVGNFAWQAGGGVTWAASDRVTLDLGYRFFAIGRGSSSLFTDPTGTYVGEYTSAFTASELLLSVRIYEPFRRRRG